MEFTRVVVAGLPDYSPATLLTFTSLVRGTTGSCEHLSPDVTHRVGSWDFLYGLYGQKPCEFGGADDSERYTLVIYFNQN